MTRPIIDRRTAMSVKKFITFFQKLSPDQQHFLAMGLPNLLSSWYAGKLNGPQKSEGLEINARKYHSVDALAVGLAHLKSVWPMKVPRTLYRLTSVKQAPTTRTITVSTTNQLKPLISWTSHKLPLVYHRKVPPGTVDIILEWKTDPRLVVMSWDWIQDVAIGIVYGLRHLRESGLWIAKDSRKNPRRRAVAPEDEALWNSVRKTALNFTSEREFLVYVPKNVVLECKWKWGT